MSSKTLTIKMEVPQMFKFKGFSGNSMQRIEEEINVFLADNPNLIPSNMQMCNDGMTLYIGILFADAPALPKFNYEIPVEAPIPYTPPREVTCDDPWKGEFIPVGDPPTQRPKVVAMKPTSRQPITRMDSSYTFAS